MTGPSLDLISLPPNPVRAMFGQIEQLIETSGVQWRFLRSAMFARNAMRWWGPQILSGDVVRWPHLAAPTDLLDERDAVRTLSRTDAPERNRSL